MKRFKNKKTLAIAGVAVAVLAIAGTIAYNQDSMFFANLFHIGADYAEFSDTFESPENWTPCTETPKTAIATNKSDAPRYVRMKIEEYWRAGDTTTPESDHETTDLPLTWNDNGTEKHYAIINTQNDDQWSLANDGWYYYDHALVKDESTLSLLKSVTFNCEVNTVGEMRYSADGKSGESIPSEYGGAKYHIYVTFQMSSEPLRTRTRLYDTVANQTLGSDSNINFNANPVTENFDWLDGYNYFTPAEKGVYTYSRGTTTGGRAVYYYRGKTRNNFLAFHGICWRIVRTTGTGGTKVIYDGLVQSDGTCQGDTVSHSVSPFTSSYYYNSDYNIAYNMDSSITASGYMLNSDYINDGYSHGTYIPDPTSRRIMTYGGSAGKVIIAPVAVSRDIVYENGVYKLSGATGTYPSSDYFSTSTPRYYYTCFAESATDTCETAGYITMAAEAGNALFYMPLTNGKKGNDVKKELFSNEENSQLKGYIDNWYASNLTDSTDKFEDTQWCNDRKVTSGPYAMVDDHNHKNNETNTFAAADRIANGTPSLECERADDRFTVSSDNGNGKLTYPVAIITADEAMLAGHNTSNTWRASYLTGANSYQDMWTMTPLNTEKRGYGAISEGALVLRFAGSNDQVTNMSASGTNNGNAIRPMVSFKYDTYVTAGDGTAANPYTLEW